MNDFSLVCRILGTLFYRLPNDAVVMPLLAAIQAGKLKDNWPFEQEELLNRLQENCVVEQLLSDYQTMFIEKAASPYASDYVDEQHSDISAFLQQVGMALPESPVDHFGFLLLAASWIEDHSAEDEIQAQSTLFDEYLLPWCGKFLGKVESHAQYPFYRTLAIMTREVLQAMRDELDEIAEQNEQNA